MTNISVIPPISCDSVSITAVASTQLLNREGYNGKIFCYIGAQFEFRKLLNDAGKNCRHRCTAA